MKLLIVDDNSDTRKLIRTMMKPLADDIIESHNGIEAIASFARHRPDWVLMDIEMKGMDGIKATQEIKSAYPDARIIILTMFDDDRLRGAAAQAGAERYVLKDNLADLQEIFGKNLK
jgi:NarL family two-component system response regulator LiaR